jgi:hypothetical protein
MNKTKAYQLAARRLREILGGMDSLTDQALARKVTVLTKPKHYRLAYKRILGSKNWKRLTKHLVARWPGMAANQVERPEVLDEALYWWEERNLKGESLRRAREWRESRREQEKRWKDHREKGKK